MRSSPAAYRYNKGKMVLHFVGLLSAVYPVQIWTENYFHAGAAVSQKGKPTPGHLFIIKVDDVSACECSISPRRHFFSLRRLYCVIRGQIGSPRVSAR